MSDQAKNGKEPIEIYEKLKQQQQRKQIQPPDLTTVRRALKGKTHRRAIKETRGRKKLLSAANIRKLNSVRKTLIKKAKGEREIHWKEIIAKAKVPPVEVTTAAKAVRNAGFLVSARPPRAKPMRSPEHMEEQSLT